MEFVQPTLSFLKWLCRIILFFYFIKVMADVFFVKTEKKSPRLREAMAMAYTLVAAGLIFQSTNAILPFVQDILNSIVKLHTPHYLLRFVLVICSGLVCSAFICNFSRSLWMLKSLDHAVFEPVPEWERLLTAKTWKNVIEFMTRTVAALLFIFIELQLEKLATHSAKEDVIRLAMGEAPHNHLADAGGYGFFLYLSLSLWWISGVLIAKNKMPLPLLFFYIGGFFNSIFIYFFAKEILSKDQAFGMALIVIVVAIVALYMLSYVLIDVIKGMKSFVKTLRSKNECGLANT